MNSSTLDSPEEPVDTPLGGGSIGGFGYGLGLSLAVLAIFMIITYASYRCKRRHPTTATTHHHHRRSTDDDYDSSPAMDIVVNINQRGGGGGLDEATISSYPRYTYSQIKPHKSGGGGGAAATCSICLADYKDSDLLRLLPECCHLFHLKCVDPWLLLHPTCPVCRNSPPQGGQVPPLAQPAPVTPQ